MVELRTQWLTVKVYSAHSVYIPFKLLGIGMTEKHMSEDELNMVLFARDGYMLVAGL